MQSGARSSAPHVYLTSVNTRPCQSDDYHRLYKPLPKDGRGRRDYYHDMFVLEVLIISSWSSPFSGNTFVVGRSARLHDDGVKQQTKVLVQRNLIEFLHKLSALAHNLRVAGKGPHSLNTGKIRDINADQEELKNAKRPL